MNANNIVVTSIAGLMLGGFPLTTGVQVVSADTGSTVKNDTNTCVSDDLVARFDDYVVVKNNQYVLELPDNDKNLFTSAEMTQVESNIAKANENVYKGSLVIDMGSKIAASESKVMSRAAYNKHFTWKNFWWGTRYYFTSNAAVAEFVWDFTNNAIYLGALGALGGAVGAALGTVSAAYFYKVANDVNYYNQRHKHNQIYMDMNYSLGYSCHILK